MATRKDKINATVVIPREWHDKLKAVAEYEQCSVSDVIRQQIKIFLSGGVHKCILFGEYDPTKDENDA